MTDEQAFLHKIQEEPDDDTPRMIYADWLREHGDGDRAEFIRLQCRASALPEWDHERVELEYRAAILLAKNWGEWTDPLWHLGMVFRRQRRFFNRGLLEHILAPQLSWVLGWDQAELLAAPTVRRLEIELVPSDRPDCSRLAKLPWFDRLAELFCTGGGMGDEIAAALAANGSLAGLSSLGLRSAGLTDDGVGVLADAANLSNLRTLNLKDNQIGPEGVRKLADSPHLANLRELRLGGNRIGDEGAELIARSRHLIRLTTLDLSGTSIGPRALRVLTGAAWWDRLSSVNLGGNDLGDEGAAVLAASRGNLKALDLHACGIGPDGARSLATSPHLAGLCRLLLGHNPIGDAGLATLIAASFLDKMTQWQVSDDHAKPALVRDLDLSSCHLVWHDGMSSLADAADLSAVTSLNLRGNYLWDEGVAILADSPYLGGLTELKLDDNRVGDPGVMRLAASPALAGLRSLSLACNEIGDLGAVSLAGSEHLNRLSELDLRANRIGHAGGMALSGAAHWAEMDDFHLGISDNPIGPEAEMALRERGERVREHRAKPPT